MRSTTGSTVVRAQWKLCLLTALVAATLTYWPQGLAVFRYEPAAILAGDVWRLLSAHLVHINTAHLLLNLVGLVLVCELFCQKLSATHIAALLLLSGVGVSVALFFLQPDLLWYAGLSGALHGLWAGAALMGSLALPGSIDERANGPNGANADMIKGATGESGTALQRWPLTRQLSVAGLLLLGIKLSVEWWSQSSETAAALIGAPVVTISHLYGAVAGLLCVATWHAAVLAADAVRAFRLK